MMRKIFASIWFVTFLLLAAQATEIDQAQKAEFAREKAEILEEKAALDGSKAPPTPAQLISKPQAQAVDPAGEEPLDDAITCLSRTIYWEARGSGIAGMKVVANVVMNRVGHKDFPKTVCGVVQQGHEQGACQFSWWCDGRPDDAKDNESYTIAKEITRKALNHQLKDKTNGALYFHHRKVIPDWSKKYIKTAEVEEFIFYKQANSKAK